jgi:DNA-binding NarL/FixJ family response regulator
MKKRVMLVDNHVATRQMLACNLRHESRYEVVGEVDTGRQALAICRTSAPDLVILELALPELCGIEVMRRLRTTVPSPRLLVFSAAMERELVTGALRCRPHGFISKQESLQTLYEAIQVVMSGGLYFTPFAASLSQEVIGDSSSTLTSREREILQMIAESHSSKEIAAQLNLAVKTVENHRAHIMEKLHLHDVAGLTRYAVRQGMVV